MASLYYLQNDSLIEINKCNHPVSSLLFKCSKAARAAAYRAALYSVPVPVK